MARLTIILLLLAAALLAGGCYEVTEHTHTTIVQHSATTIRWVIGVPVGIVTICALIGAVWRSGTAWIIGAIVAVFATLIVPGICMDTLEITPQRITQTTGFWFAPTVKGFAYEQVSAVRQEWRRERSGRSGTRNNLYWIVEYRDGRTEEIDLGDLWENNRDVAIPRLQQYGVSFR